MENKPLHYDGSLLAILDVVEADSKMETASELTEDIRKYISGLNK